MPEYRIYVVDGRNHITSAHDYVGSSDVSASHQADKLRDGGPVEVWQSTRLVLRAPGDATRLQLSDASITTRNYPR